MRHALLAATFGVLLLLPVASMVAPPVRIAVPVVTQNRAAAASSRGGHRCDSPVTPADAARSRCAPQLRDRRGFRCPLC